MYVICGGPAWDACSSRQPQPQQQHHVGSGLLWAIHENSAWLAWAMRAGQKPVLAHQARPQSPFKRAKHSYISTNQRPVLRSRDQSRPIRGPGGLQLQILSDQWLVNAPNTLFWLVNAPDTFWLNSTICRASSERKIEELNHYGSKLKSLSLGKCFGAGTIFLMQWRKPL